MMCVSSCRLCFVGRESGLCITKLAWTGRCAACALAVRMCSHLRRPLANPDSAFRKQRKVKQAGRSFLVTSRQRGNENVDEETYKHGSYRKQITIARKNVCVVVAMVGCVTLSTENKTRDPCTGSFQSPFTSWAFVIERHLWWRKRFRHSSSRKHLVPSTPAFVPIHQHLPPSLITRWAFCCNDGWRHRQHMTSKQVPVTSLPNSSPGHHWNFVLIKPSCIRTLTQTALSSCAASVHLQAAARKERFTKWRSSLKIDESSCPAQWNAMIDAGMCTNGKRFLRTTVKSDEANPNARKVNSHQSPLKKSLSADRETFTADTARSSSNAEMYLSPFFSHFHTAG